MRRVRRWFLVTAATVAALAAAGIGSRAEAQGRPLNVSGTQLLNFPTVFPGLPELVPTSDPVNAGRFSVTGIRNSEVQLTFTLPASLTAPGGYALPLQFGPGDGAWNTQNTLAAAQAFDPRVPLVTRFSNNGRLFLWLGGTALPSGTQVSGIYTGSITLAAAYTGN